MIDRPIELHVNGTAARWHGDPAQPLLFALRDKLGLTGTKYGCGRGQCGVCTVTLDGDAARSCVLPVSAAVGKAVVTIEGLAEGDRLHRLQEAWLEHRVSQCGYCQAGMLMAARALLQRTPRPTEMQVRAGITNLCRCGSYPRVVRAVLAAAT